MASKVEWSVVQAVQAQSKEADDRITFATLNNYSLVGIAVPDKRKMVWIMLNPKNPPYYKQLPPGNYTLSKDELNALLQSGVVTSTVERCLESHVEYAP
jgi:hypothetical protein